MLMQKYIKSILAIMFMANGALAYADETNGITLAAIMFGGNSQSSVVCYLYNPGKTPVGIASKAIYNADAPTATSITLLADTCGNSIAAKSTCFVAATNIDGRHHTCDIALSTINAKNIRGEMEIRDSSNNILNSGLLQ